ncbi:MAG: hypothetical protein IT308_08325 [Anaerolineaceae bacterium]|nr:hypothetical protein [Anaerolineaceae bacterium]
METISSKDRSILAGIAAVAGVLCFTVVPFLAMRAMNAVLNGAAIKIPASGNPLIATAPRIVLAFFPVWAGLTVAAGLILLMVAWAISQGESWAKPVAVGLLAIPSITGAYYSGPIMFFAKENMPVFLIIALIGLIPYFIILLWGRKSPGGKVGQFFLFLMLGITSAWSFANGGSSLRMFWARPEQYTLDAGNTGFILGIPVIWAGVLLTIIAIPLLAATSRRGWFVGFAGLLAILGGNAVLFITHSGTREFMFGVIMAVVSLILLWAPKIGGYIKRPAAPHTV